MYDTDHRTTLKELLKSQHRALSPREITKRRGPEQVFIGDLAEGRDPYLPSTAVPALHCWPVSGISEHDRQLDRLSAVAAVASCRQRKDQLRPDLRYTRLSFAERNR